METSDQKVQRLFDILPNQLNQFPQKDAVCDKVGGSWRKFSSKACQEIVDKVSLGLLKMEFHPGDKFAIISYNRTEWTMLDLGILQIGCVDVPLYPNMSPENYEYIFNDSQVKLVFVENEELFIKVKKVITKTPSVKEIYTFNEVNEAKHWTAITNLADESLRPRLNEIEKAVTQEDLATIIYTSGTTGIPKGVPLTHLNILSNVKSIADIMPMTNADKMLSFLPICHIFERTAVYFYLYLGGSVYFAESIEKVGDNLKEVKPNYFTTVPRLMEKIYDKIMDKGRNLSPAKKAIFGWAVNLANHYDPRGENSLFYKARLVVARKLVFSKWMEALGGEVKGIISGAAALQPRLSRIFTAAGATIREGYGLTETSPVLTCNRFKHGDYYLGSVGVPLPGVEIKLSESGEILAKGDNVMKGYYNKPDETKAVIDDEGWFHTGDVGEWIDGKFLKITDRVKEIFKTSGGKFIAPLPIENKMKESNFIGEIMVIGENQKHAAAIIVPQFDFIRKWAEKKCPDVKTNEEMATSSVVKGRIWKDVEKYNKRFGHIQQIKKIELVPDTWAVDSGELTPTLKLKRRVILAKYKNIIEKIYSE
ncbi:MAG: long-chain fatty acid--CoA ligase [Ignavibacteria bacterium CG22_combo_CG10-13_8_21_14_all_37_15]|nr:MAG: long-chain fatty acid--CoA ligase [Ignavibacteria bacterium CG22_combo_CG10-13_8_21_14_all_37_15]